MALLVKKFGGTSVGDIKKIQNIASSICQSKEAGNEIVVVVSVMGKTTDDLNCLAESISKNPNRRELDMLLSTGEQVTIALLSMALNEYGIPAISMTGSQVGIISESIHGKARILEIKTDKGVSAWLVREPSIPIISVQIIFRGGTATDPAGKEGHRRGVPVAVDRGAGLLPLRGGLPRQGLRPAGLGYGPVPGPDLRLDWGAGGVDGLRVAHEALPRSLAPGPPGLGRAPSVPVFLPHGRPDPHRAGCRPASLCQLGALGGGPAAGPRVRSPKQRKGRRGGGHGDAAAAGGGGRS